MAGGEPDWPPSMRATSMWPIGDLLISMNVYVDACQYKCHAGPRKPSTDVETLKESP
ncbi:predicted protein [Streptomyces filamentosus NRRL 15998]|uniref:Predicted protein n=1 Tax=Streptomyces filamentosus NRRL 15998 TaxID=457431 RepID=D6ATV9_STRFL|nr:predicted protein [Streptomyces filamentosus NRRL 15998]